MNAGAHGKEMKDIVTKIKAVDYDFNKIEFTNKEAEFEYRTSIFKNNNYVIYEVELELEKAYGKKEEINKKQEEYRKYRKEKQPIEWPSAGSTFKRGSNFITAKLINDANLKGISVGDAEVSTKHSGFVINKGNASCKDVLELVKKIEREVFEKFGKNIELEIEIIGENKK